MFDQVTDPGSGSPRFAVNLPVTVSKVLADFFQVEGGVVMGASGALIEEVTVKDGRVVARGLADYPLFTTADMPEIETIIVHRPDLKPSGCGEPPIGPIAPAIGNAFHALTGVRLRQLPMTPERVLAALKSEAPLLSPSSAASATDVNSIRWR